MQSQNDNVDKPASPRSTEARNKQTRTTPNSSQSNQNPRIDAPDGMRANPPKIPLKYRYFCTT
ncbi:unnamed protein product, partial [Nesidiocoris tenuis]